jgi:uncharacterized protein (TIGR02680 family)
VTDVPGDSQTSEATLFDVDEFRASDNAHRHALVRDLPDDLTPTQRILLGGLPVPTSSRWKPLRCGLVNLYLFDNEVFPFADGRLLLRGDNGAGKSRVLALTLPLLLDGRLHPSRVEPDRDSNRQIAWNLLMDEHADRSGYTWIEFGRVDENGQTHFTTLGIGLRGVRSRGITDHWMFVTSQRIGETLALITPEKRVASKRVLIDALGDSGQLYESSTDYRRAVDEAMFRLNDRYEALLDLLLQLRQPQLAKRLDLAGLEAALVQSMPPVSSTLLSDAADAFRSLDQERETLNGLQQARITVQEFLRPYRRHLRLGIRRAAGRLRTRHSKYEQAGKDLRDAQHQKQSVDADTAKISEQRDSCLRNQKATAVALQTLQADPAMKQAERLNGARQLHDAATDALTHAKTAKDRLTREVEESAHETAESHDETVRRLRRAEQLRATAAELAAPEALQRLHTEQFAGLRTTDFTADSAHDPAAGLVENLPHRIDAAEQDLGARIDHWLRTGRHLAELHQDVVDATESLKTAVRRLDDAQDRLHSVADELAAAIENVTSTAETVWQEVEFWWVRGETLTMSPDDLEVLRAAWFDWTEGLQGASPVTLEADAALRRLSNGIAAERSELQQRQHALQTQQDELNDELHRLHSGESVRPVAPATRGAGVRVNQPGAALWELLEFVPAVPHTDRAGWEAGLEGACLLDAWIHPDGRVTDPDSMDTVLTVADDEVGDASHRLSRILMPASDCREFGVEPHVLGNILNRIGTGSGSHRIWIDAAGRWQNGPLTGRCTKPIPQFVGRDVREAWRARRIDELDETLARLVDEFTEAQDQLEQLAERERQGDEHRRLLPDDGPLRSAVARRQEAQRQRQEAQSRVTDATAHEREWRQRRDDSLTSRNTVALDVGLQDWADQPDVLLQRIDAYRVQVPGCFESWRLTASAAERQARCTSFEARKRTEQQEHEIQLQAAAHNESSRRAALEELRKTVGVDAQEITRRIADKERDLARLETDVDRISQELLHAERTAAKLEARLETLGGRLEEADRLRREGAAALAELTDFNLLPTADSQLADVLHAPGSLTATVELARRIEKLDWRVPEIGDDEAWKRNQRQIYDALEPLKGRLTSFSMNAEPEFIGEHICCVQIRHQADLVTPDLLVKRLDAEVDEHERVLSENERTILEKHLLGEVAGELHERMHLARELVDSMNREVSGRPMKTGMQMRFRWEPDHEGPAGLAAACQVLATGAATWSDADRRELGQFLHEQITVSREQDDAGSRLEQLTAALDYRRWHRLRIDRRAAQDQDWKLLTRKTYGSGSGGEKAIALTLPQVAAAAAYYRTASPLAPRLILMDEVFAGISSNNRAACMELLAAFELDVVMTSESEWGCYSTVPQLAICQLTRMPDLAAIDNTVFVWNGRERLSADTADTRPS